MIKPNTVKPRSAKADLTRRRFFRLAGVGAAVTFIGAASSCSKNQVVPPVTAAGPPDVGSGDTGILNLIYALQQFEQALYSRVSVANSVQSFTSDEKILLSQVFVHEDSHKAVLNFYLGSARLPDLAPDFSTVNFNNRQNFLAAARLLENNSVACMNSLAYQLKNSDLINFVAKMVAVDARHAAYINNLISPGNFDDTTFVDLTTGMERPVTVSETLTYVNSFLKEKITANHL